MKKIIVFGAGLSGLYAAKTAAINGSRVKVLERKKEVGSFLKCGEMFTCIYGRPPEKCITREIKEWVFDFSSVKELEHSGIVEVRLPPGFAVMTDRATHEKILYEECLKLGVEFRFGVNATMSDLSLSHDFSNAKYIIATGTDRWNRKAFANCFTVECEEYPDSVHYAYFKITPDLKGYYWAFPKTNKEINIGWGCDDTSDERYTRSGYEGIIKNVCDFSDRFVVRGTAIKPVKIINNGGGRIPINSEYKNIRNYVGMYASEMIYVGDKAGLVNPMLMGGEHLAVLSGQLAGYICSNNSIDSGEKYYNAITEIIAPEMEIGIMVNNMRTILNSEELYGFFKNAVKYNYENFNEVMINYIKRTMSKHMKVPEVTNKELEDII